MREKELKINIPKGYEIDKENSTFECIKFKPIKNTPTYKEIAAKLNKDICFFISKGKIQSYGQFASYDNPDVTDNAQQLEKLLAINKLFNIVRYYNEDWEPNWNDKGETKYIITNNVDKYKIYDTELIDVGMPVFRSKENAQAVIDNPNFRDILDTIFK